MRTVVICCLWGVIIPLVNGRSENCTAAFASASKNGNVNARHRDGLLNIAQGNPRSQKCKALKANGLHPKCKKVIDAACSSIKFGDASGSNKIPSGCALPDITCNSSTPYRTFDGSCNNLLNPHWGQFETQQKRLLDNAYHDGKDKPRKNSCTGKLPTARMVSNMIHKADTSTFYEPYLSQLAVNFGQFLAHDMVLTKTFTRSDGTPLACCKEDKNNKQCDPIEIPNDDNYFEHGSCMEFSRSKASTDCHGIRQQINSQTSYLDLSMTYGNSEDEAASLRTFSGGRLKHVNNKLPVDVTDSTCVLAGPFDATNNYCPLAGDVRVNEQPGLASMHTLFMREHNRLADGLAATNGQWDDERLFQEARKINIAQWQNIIYAEYLPAVLGQTVLDSYNLNIESSGFQDYYNESVDASIVNSFAAAVFRYGHTQASSNLGRVQKNPPPPTTVTEPLQKHFFDPKWYHLDNGQGLEDIFDYVASNGCPMTDRKLEDIFRLKLFLDDAGKSFDLASLNIQRGRDHGIPGYTEFRKFCGLSDVTHFGNGSGGLVDHDTVTAGLLEQVYSCPSDIDLFTGILSEQKTQNSVLGPAWQCLLASQFKSLRQGDRFFFDRNDPLIGFSLAQLNSIKTVSMSDLICLNTDIQAIQPNSFLQPTSGCHTNNTLADCSTYVGVDLSQWVEMMAYIIF